MSLLDSAKAFGSKALEKGQEAAGIAKTKLAIAENENAVKKVLEEIANDILANHPDFLEANYGDQFAQISELKAKIAELAATLEKKDE